MAENESCKLSPEKNKNYQVSHIITADRDKKSVNKNKTLGGKLWDPKSKNFNLSNYLAKIRRELFDFLLAQN